MASAKTLTKARTKAEKIDGVKDALLRRAVKSEFDDGVTIDAWWQYGACVHLVFPNGRGIPDGYYAKSYGPKTNPVLVCSLRVQDMAHLTLEQMAGGTVFQLAELAELG
jgi:hypothetical protein